MPVTLDTLLLQIPADAEDKVKQVRNRHNTQIRNLLGQETGLRLNRLNPGESISVPVNLVAGLPDALKKIEFEDTDLLAVLVPQYLTYLEKLADGCPPVEQLIDKISKISNELEYTFEDTIAIQHTGAIASSLLRNFNDANPTSVILSVNEDVLGTYKHNPATGNNKIELYWAVIALVARLISVPIEALTYVVLTHELAHAFTHIGSDIDGQKWDDDGFFKTDLSLVEGLAQYYTHIICQQMNYRVSEAFVAYERLLIHQTSDYKTHLPWIENYSAELVRSAMIETRRVGSQSINDFTASLSQAGQRLGIPVDSPS